MFKDEFTLGISGLFKMNSMCDYSVSAAHLNKCEHSNPNKLWRGLTV